MIYYTGLDRVVYDMYKQLSDIEELTIISGYVGSETVKRLETLPSRIHASIVYGMYGREQISAPLHKALLEIQDSCRNIDIYYSRVPVHSKIYLWNTNKSLKKALIGSANFSVSGLMNDYREILSDVEESSYSNLTKYCSRILRDSIHCNDQNVKVKSVNLNHKFTEEYKGQYQLLLKEGICRASLLDAHNQVPAKSGLNWGLSKGHVKLGDAYIKISMDYIRDFPQLFPAKKYVGIENTNSTGRRSRENDEVELIWDDGVRMIGLLEGQQSAQINGSIYPKQLSSSPNKSILGVYLRKRLGVSLEHRITTRDLLRYGRANIDIALIGEGIYYLDFSVNK